MPGHGVENRAGETTAHPLCIDQFLADFGVSHGRAIETHSPFPLPQVPEEVEPEELQKLTKLPGARHVPAEVSSGAIEMRAEPLASHIRPQDVRGAFSDTGHLGVPDELFDAERRLATDSLWIRRLIPRAPENDLSVL